MLFMVIERFRDNDMVPVYRRLRDGGRSLPEGLEYVDSWVEASFSLCFQLMRCDDLRLIQAWILEWRGSGVTFDIVPVVTSAEARAVVEPHLDRPERQPDRGRRPALPKLISSHFACIHGPAAKRRGGFREEMEADVPFAL
jgi:hypothetical protein